MELYNPIGDDIAIGGWFSGVADISPNPESDLNLGSWLAYSHGEVDFFDDHRSLRSTLSSESADLSSLEFETLSEKSSSSNWSSSSSS